MKYPFDVNQSILWLGDLADLIFVFFDPIGQALCKRTLNLVEKLNEKHAERMRFYLSKADEAGHEADRQRVMMQIVQELCKRPGLNRTGFDMPTIYIPNPNKPSRCVNQIDEVAKDIEKTINQTVQNTLNSLERDCETIASLVQQRLQLDAESSSHNFWARSKSCCFTMLGLLLPILLVVSFLASSASVDILRGILGKDMALEVIAYLKPVTTLWSVVPTAYHLYVWASFGVLTLFLLLLAKLSSRKRPTLSRRQKRQLQENRDYVIDFVKRKKQTLYQQYLQQSVAEHDL